MQIKQGGLPAHLPVSIFMGKLSQTLQIKKYAILTLFDLGGKLSATLSLVVYTKRVDSTFVRKHHSVSLTQRHL